MNFLISRSFKSHWLLGSVLSTRSILGVSSLLVFELSTTLLLSSCPSFTSRSVVNFELSKILYLTVGFSARLETASPWSPENKISWLLFLCRCYYPPVQTSSPYLPWFLNYSSFYIYPLVVFFPVRLCLNFGLRNLRLRLAFFFVSSAYIGFPLAYKLVIPAFFIYHSVLLSTQLFNL